MHQVAESPDEISRDPAKLLRAGEVRVPERVSRTVAFLRGAGAWFQLSRNHEVRSCREAANRRWRLGHQGISLCDELKSFLGAFRSANGEQQVVLAHCRGDRRLNFERLAEVLGTTDTAVRLSEHELAGSGMEYGLVNPFEINDEALDMGRRTRPVFQVFDREVITPVGVPGTMMTNAGELTWAVEFFPADVIPHINGAVVADIADSDPEAPTRLSNLDRTRRIGIITGNGPESGITLWGHINRSVRDLLGPRCFGDVSMPPVTVESVPEMGLSMELDSREDYVWRSLGSTVRTLCESGITLLTLACNTTQFFAPQIKSICDEYGTEFMSIADATATWLKAQEVKKVALLGIKYVTDFDHWSAYRAPLDGIEVEQLSQRATDLIHELGYDVKTYGVTNANLNHFRDLLRKEISSQYVVVALTELSLLLRPKWRGDSGKTLIDPLVVYGQAIGCKYLGIPFPPGTGSTTYGSSAA